MNEGPFILDIDLSKQAVIEPGVENLQYKFHEKLLLHLFQIMNLTLF